MSVTLLLAGALLSQAALPATSPVLRMEMTAREASVNDHAITASARIHRTGWLTTSRDAEGQYQAWVNVADLDLSTAAGLAKMNSRVKRASSALCQMAAEGPEISGFHNRGSRACLSSAEDQAARQTANAHEAALQGRPVAILGLTDKQ